MTDSTRAARYHRMQSVFFTADLLSAAHQQKLPGLPLQGKTFPLLWSGGVVVKWTCTVPTPHRPFARCRWLALCSSTSHVSKGIYVLAMYKCVCVFVYVCASVRTYVTAMLPVRGSKFSITTISMIKYSYLVTSITTHNHREGHAGCGRGERANGGAAFSASSLLCRYK